MKRLIAWVTGAVFATGLAWGQRDVRPLPREAFTAKTIAILNNTHNEAVEQGALEALRRWGRFKVIDDSEAADVTLTFEKKSEHEGGSTQKTGDNGKPTTSYSMSFSSSVYMKAALKGSTLSFFKASTSESKKKAGAECVTDLQHAYSTRP